MDRTAWIAAVLLVALGGVGIWFAVSPTSLTSVPGDIDALRAIGAALFAAGLTTFLVVALHGMYHRRA